ncbi:hypothetical protein HZ326_26396 [Fusarium oxysporum f. sp. albedinis]|nr:hypothetical protein HZ326_26396 [Fusarium oxysporum f. sp. albedinis]
MQRLDEDPFAIPTRERAGMQDLTQRFAQVRDAWLCKATYSPIGYILSLLVFRKKIARKTGSRLMVFWSKQGEMMYFMGKATVMQDLRTMVVRMTTDDIPPASPTDHNRDLPPSTGHQEAGQTI